MRWLFGDRKRAEVDRSDWIDDVEWTALVARQAFLARLSEDELKRLRALCGAFLVTKAVNGAAGLVLTNAMIAAIVTQACLPILELGLAAYPAFEEIIVYPNEFIVDREIVDADGVVHAWSEAIAGESWEQGPVVLAWDATERMAKANRPTPFAFNVVIHEFVHKLDMSNGDVDGMPAFSRKLHAELDEKSWLTVLQASFDDLNQRLEDVERSIPRHVDPESARADRFYAALPIDAYAATDEGEFFSVTSEAFFVAPEGLHAAYPDWYDLLVGYFRQDPLRAVGAG